MGFYRIYKGSDDKSHIEELSPNEPAFRTLRPVKGFFFKDFPPGTFLDWHPAPRRQIVIILSGVLEHGFADGSTHRFSAGDVRLLEDTTGEGHTTRVIGDEAVSVAVVSLPEGDGD